MPSLKPKDAQEATTPTTAPTATTAPEAAPAAASEPPAAPADPPPPPAAGETGSNPVTALPPARTERFGDIDEAMFLRNAEAQLVAIGSTEPQVGFVMKKVREVASAIKAIANGQSPIPQESSVATAPVNAEVIASRLPVQAPIDVETNRTKWLTKHQEPKLGKNGELLTPGVPESPLRHPGENRNLDVVRFIASDGADVVARPNEHGKIILVCRKQYESIMAGETFGEVPQAAYQIVRDGVATLVNREQMKLLSGARG
jgi:hypothetical protein